MFKVNFEQVNANWVKHSQTKIELFWYLLRCGASYFTGSVLDYSIKSLRNSLSVDMVNLQVISTDFLLSEPFPFYFAYDVCSAIKYSK